MPVVDLAEVGKGVERSLSSCSPHRFIEALHVGASMKRVGHFVIEVDGAALERKCLPVMATAEPFFQNSSSVEVVRVTEPKRRGDKV